MRVIIRVCLNNLKKPFPDQSQRLFFFRCAASGLLEVPPGRIYYKTPRAERTPLSLNLQHILPEREDSDSLNTVVVCKETTSLGKHINKTSKQSRREEHN